MQINNVHETKSFIETLSDIETHFCQKQFQECKRKFKELNCIELKDEMNYFHWITRSDCLICDYLDMRENKTLSIEGFQSIQEGFHEIMKEWIYKSSIVSQIDLILMNNILYFCCLCFIHGYEQNIRNIDNFSVTIISLRKALCLLSGIKFIPPSNFTIENPSYEIKNLLRDILKCLRTLDPESQLLFTSNFIMLLQYLLIAESLPSYKRWTDVLPVLGFIENDVINLLDSKEESFIFNDVGICSTSLKERKHSEKSINIYLKTTEKSQNKFNILEEMPVFMFSHFGDPMVYQKDKSIFLRERDIMYLLIFTVFLTCELHVSKRVYKIPSFNDFCMSSGSVLNQAWLYLKGFLLFKGGRIKEAKELIETVNFYSLEPHFKTKKVLLTACILSKDNNHDCALSILNSEGMNCEDCLPATLCAISDEHEFLGQKESQLKSLRLAFKLLRHKKMMEKIKSDQSEIFLRTLDLISVSTEVTLTKVLHKLATNLAHNELYEESAERFLDLLAILEVKGPSESIPHIIHSVAAVLLLNGDNGGRDRSKEAATLCRRAAEILSHNFDVTEEKSSPEVFSVCGPSPCKRPRLEMHIGNVLMELESGTDEDNLQMDIDDTEENDNIFDPLASLHIGVISSTLMSSGRDLTSFILLSECAIRENDFRSSTLLLNRCLHILSNQQSRERSEMNPRSWFLDVTDFIISHIYLRKAKMLCKREVMEKKDFGNDIRFCFINALKHNTDDPEIKYFYIKYMSESKKIKYQAIIELSKNLNFNCKDFSILPSKENLAAWYLFKPTISNDQFETLLSTVRTMGK